MGRPQTAEAIGNGYETLISHEEFYIPVAINKDTLFCGDDRPLEGPYIQLFGGIVNTAYNQAILQEANNPGSVIDSLRSRVETLTAAFIDNDMHPGVHSDAKAEGGKTLRQSSDGSVGCAYADKRPLISANIAKLGDDLIDEAERLQPGLFKRPEDREFAQAVVAAHGRLAERESFQTTGRSLVLAAAKEGAAVAILDGEHTASDGIINLRRNTTLDGKAAAEAGLPAYNHDAWAFEEAAERLDDQSDPNQRQIANLIDAIGTMSALGVEAIAVRG